MNLILNKTQNSQEMPGSASSEAVEKDFSSTGFDINEHRMSLHPHQVDNIIVISSMENLKK